MTLRNTHDLVNSAGESEKLSVCTCGSCGNQWWVRTAIEHQPSYCPYCGIKFQWYEDGVGGEYGISGLPKPPSDECVRYSGIMH